MKKKKPRLKAIEHKVETVTIDFKQKGQKRRLLQVQRYKKPIQIKDIDLSKNPEKMSFLILRNEYGDRLEMFAYISNPRKAFISLNGEVIGITHHTWRELQSGVTAIGKFFGILRGFEKAKLRLLRKKGKLTPPSHSKRRLTKDRNQKNVPKKA